MADKELRRLKRRELLQMLLMECEEAENLSQESVRLREQLDAMQEQMTAVMESYERLKKKLDVKDARLNQKDEKIAMLKQEVEEWKAQAMPQPQAETAMHRLAVNAGRIIPIHYGKTAVSR